MGTAAIKKGLGTEASEQVRKRAANEGRVGSEARWRAHSGSVSDGDRKPLEGLCEGVAQRGHYNDQVHGTSQAPKKHPITKRGDGWVEPPSSQVPVAPLHPSSRSEDPVGCLLNPPPGPFAPSRADDYNCCFPQ